MDTNFSDILTRLKQLIGFEINRPEPTSTINGTDILGSLIGSSPQIAAAFTSSVNSTFGTSLAVGVIQPTQTVYQVAAHIYSNQ